MDQFICPTPTHIILGVVAGQQCNNKKKLKKRKEFIACVSSSNSLAYTSTDTVKNICMVFFKKL